MTTYFSDFLGSIFWGILMLYVLEMIVYCSFSFRDFFKYRPPRDIRDVR